MGKVKGSRFSAAKGIAILATLIYFVLAVYRIDFQSIWYDEGLTLHYSSPPLLNGLGELAQRSVHPPLYFSLMHFWLSAVGDSDFAARFLSAVFGALFVASSFVFGARLADRRLGAISALVTATSPFVVYYGQEARMYTAVAFLSTLSTVEALRIAREGKGYAGFAIVSALAVFTHYFAFLVLGSQLVIIAPFLLLRRRWRHLARWLGALAVAVALLIPWAASLLRVAATHEDFWRAKLSFKGMVQDAVLHFSLGEVAWPDNPLIYVFYLAAGIGLTGIFRRSLRRTVLVAVVALLASFVALVVFPKATYVARYMLVVAPAYFLLVAAGVYAMFDVSRVPAKASSNPPLSRSSGSVLPGEGSAGVSAHDRPMNLNEKLGCRSSGSEASAGVTPFPAEASDPGYTALPEQKTEVHKPRLLKVTIPPWRTAPTDVGIDGSPVSGIGNPGSGRFWRLLKPCLGVILVVLLLGSNIVSLMTGYYAPSSFRREDFRSLASYLEPKLKPGDGFVFVAGPLNYSLFHYLPETTPSIWVDSDVRLGQNAALPELAGFLGRSNVRRIWLVRSLVSADDLVDPDRVTQRRVMEQFGVMTALKDMRGLMVEAYDRDLYEHFKEGRQVDITFGNEVGLPRYRLGISPGGQFEVELFWEPARRVSRLLWVSLQLVERESGKMVALVDFPAGGLVPTTTWGPGMRVADKATLGIPGDASPGEYDAYLIVYDPVTKERLGVVGGLQEAGASAARLFTMQVDQ